MQHVQEVFEGVGPVVTVCLGQGERVKLGAGQSPPMYRFKGEFVRREWYLLKLLYEGMIVKARTHQRTQYHISASTGEAIKVRYLQWLQRVPRLRRILHGFLSQER